MSVIFDFNILIYFLGHPNKESFIFLETQKNDWLESESEYSCELLPFWTLHELLSYFILFLEPICHRIVVNAFRKKEKKDDYRSIIMSAT